MILEIHGKIKTCSIPESGSGNFFDLYGGHLSALHARLGVGLVVSEIPISNVQPRNPYEHPITGFERRMKQIEELWPIGDRTRKAKAEAEARKAEAKAEAEAEARKAEAEAEAKAEAEAEARKAEAEAEARKAEARITKAKDARKEWLRYKQDLLLSAEDMGVKYSHLHEHIRKLYILISKKLEYWAPFLNSTSCPPYVQTYTRIQYNLKRYSIKCDNVLKGLSAFTNELKTRMWHNDNTYDKGLGELSQIVTDCFKCYKVMDEYVTRLSKPVPTHE